MSKPTADDLALAREIVQELSLFWRCTDTIASLIAKHRQPPTMTQEEVYAEIERVLNCTIKPLFTCKSRPSLEQLQMELDSWKTMAVCVHRYCDEHSIPKPPENEPGILWRVIRLVEENERLRAAIEEELSDCPFCEPDAPCPGCEQLVRAIAPKGPIP